MANNKTSQADVEKKFEGLTGRPDGAFPKNMPYGEKVEKIAEGNRVLEAKKSAQRKQDLKGQMKNIPKLNQEVAKQEGDNTKEIRELKASIPELKKIQKELSGNTSENGGEEARDNLKRLDEQLERDGITVSEKVENLRHNPEFKEAAKNLQDTETEKSKDSERGMNRKAKEASVQPPRSPQESTDKTPSKGEAINMYPFRAAA